MDELLSAGDSTEVCHDIIGNHEQYWQREPNKAIVDIVHDVFELPHRQTQDDNRPAKLIQLKFDMTRLHGGNCQYKRSSIQTERKQRRPLRILQQIMKLGIPLDHLHGKLRIRVKYRNEEPHPLRRTKKRYGLIDPIEEGIVADRDQFAEEQYF